DRGLYQGWRVQLRRRQYHVSGGLRHPDRGRRHDGRQPVRRGEGRWLLHHREQPELPRRGDLRRGSLQDLREPEADRRHPLFSDRLQDQGLLWRYRVGARCRLFGAPACGAPRVLQPEPARGGRLWPVQGKWRDAQGGARSAGHAYQDGLFQLFHRVPAGWLYPAAAHPRFGRAAAGDGCRAGVQVGNAHQLRTRRQDDSEQHLPLQRRHLSRKSG
ncbi:hypothetical protein OY671_009302, partial [Metschnikowia pulcherrima]